MPIPFNDAAARVYGALTSDQSLNNPYTGAKVSPGDEFIAAITNAAVLSADTMNRLQIACGSAVIAQNIQNCILGLQPLVPNDLDCLQDVLTDPNVGLMYAQLMAGGLQDKYGNVTYPAVPTAQVATPTFSPVAGSYVGTQHVTVSCATAGVTMYYTTNGSTPTTSSTLYSGPISVASSETIKVLAVKSGFINSAIASAAYVIS